MDTSCDKFDLLLAAFPLGTVLLSEAEGGLWSATCLYSERKKRMLRAAGEEGGNLIQSKTFAGVSKEAVLLEVVNWAESEFEETAKLVPQRQDKNEKP